MLTSMACPPLSCWSCWSSSMRSLRASVTRACTSKTSSFTLLSSRMLASPTSIRCSYILRSCSLPVRRWLSILSVWLRRMMSRQISSASSRMSLLCLSSCCWPAFLCMPASRLQSLYLVGNLNSWLTTSSLSTTPEYPFLKKGLYSTDGPPSALSALMSSTSASLSCACALSVRLLAAICLSMSPMLSVPVAAAVSVASMALIAMRYLFINDRYDKCVE